MTTTEQSSPSVWTSWRMLGLHLVIWGAAIIATVYIKSHKQYLILDYFLCIFFYIHCGFLLFVLGQINSTSYLVRRERLIRYIALSKLLYFFLFIYLDAQNRIANYFDVVISWIGIIIISNLLNSMSTRYTAVCKANVINLKSILNPEPFQFSLRSLMIFFTVFTLSIAIYSASTKWQAFQVTDLASPISTMGLILIHLGLYYGMLSYYIQIRQLSLTWIIILLLYMTCLQSDVRWMNSQTFFVQILICNLLYLLYRWAGLRIVPVAATQPTSKVHAKQATLAASPFED